MSIETEACSMDAASDHRFTGCMQWRPDGLPRRRVRALYIGCSQSDGCRPGSEKGVRTGTPPCESGTRFASSGKLQRQIEQGAPADLFISAGEKEMDALTEQGPVVTDHHRSLLHNELVLIVPRNDKRIKDFGDLTKANQIAVGQPRTVPAGEYSKQALQYMKLWDPLKSRMVFAGDVRQVLTYVETGNVDAGLVYRTDAEASDQVTVAATAPPESHRSIVYPVGVVKGSKNREEADRFHEWLYKKKAGQFFVNTGFGMLRGNDAVRFLVPSSFVPGGYIGIQHHCLYSCHGIGRMDERAEFSGETAVGNLMDVAAGVAAVSGGVWTLFLLGRNSWLGQMMEWVFSRPVVFTWWAAVIAATVVAFPLVYQVIKTGLESVDPELEDAARSMGAGEVQVLRFVTFPLAWRSLLTAYTLGFARALGEFGATLMFAGNIPGKTQTLPTAIYIAVESGELETAYYWVGTILLVSFGLLSLVHWIRRDPE